MRKLALTFLGGLLMALGALWALQGLGILPWPPDSPMLAQREWGLYGGLAILIGALIVWLASRIGQRRR